MRPEGSPEELEHRRQLAIRRYIEGYSADEIAEFLGVSTRAVWRWFASFRGQGLQGFGVGFHPHSLSRWLRGHGLTPQKPERVPRERDPAAIAEWLKSQWPRIKKRRGDRVPTSPWSMRAACWWPRRPAAPGLYGGQTPCLPQRGAHRQKVPVAAARRLSPRRDRLGLYFHTLPGG